MFFFPLSSYLVNISHFTLLYSRPELLPPFFFSLAKIKTQRKDLLPLESRSTFIALEYVEERPPLLLSTGMASSVITFARSATRMLVDPAEVSQSSSPHPCHTHTHLGYFLVCLVLFSTFLEFCTFSLFQFFHFGIFFSFFSSILEVYPRSCGLVETVRA